MRQRLLQWLDAHMPKALCSIQLQILMYIAAKSAGRKMPWILLKKKEQALEQFALYTVDICRQAPCTRTLAEGFYRHAYRAGTMLAAVLRGMPAEQLRQVLVLLYRNIGITMVWDDSTHVTITQCYFSSFYTREMCHVMSGMDCGIMNGILGTKPLQFSQRITEGAAVCKACRGDCPGCRNGGYHEI